MFALSNRARGIMFFILILFKGNHEKSPITSTIHQLMLFSINGYKSNTRGGGKKHVAAVLSNYSV